MELADSYYPGQIAIGTTLAEPLKIRGGAVTLLANLGHAPDVLTEQVSARLPDADEVTTLQISEQEPILVLTRLSRDAAGLPVEYAVNRMVARMNPPLSYRIRTSAA